MKSSHADKIKEGNIITGKITGIQPYGLFVKLSEECSGLIHKTELNELEAENMEHYFKVGQLLKVKILRIKPGGKQAILRIHRAPLRRRRRTAKHFETTRGFESLKEQLPLFIRAALKKQKNN